MSTIAAQDAELLTRDETAALLRIRPQTLSSWAHHRRYPALRYIKVGKSVRYRLCDVLAFLEARSVGGLADSE